MSRELDAKVAEKVMGLPHDAVWLRTRPRNDIPKYTTDLIADYEVFKHVREAWGREAQSGFYQALDETWLARGFDELPCSAYELGDYSKAALKALGEID